MMPRQFIVGPRRSIECPVCGRSLVVEREQDARVAFMHHDSAVQCPFVNKLYRVDRLTGFSEEVVREEPTKVQVPPRRFPRQGSERQGPGVNEATT